MATRLFFDYNVAASSWPTKSAIWEAEAGTPLRRRLDRARYGSTGALSTTYSDTTATNPWDVMMVVGVSKPLQGDQTITGTWKSLVSVAESSASADFISQGVIRVFSGDMTTERGVIYAGNGLTTVTGNGEFATSQQTRAIVPQASGTPSDIAVSSVAALSGDVIVVEYGFRALNTVTTSFTGTFHVLNSQNVTGTPTPETIATSSSVSWIEFSQDLVFTGDYALGDADDIDVPFDLTATMSTPVGLSLAGSIDAEVGLDLTTNFIDRKIGRDEFEALVVTSAPYLYWPLTEGSGATILDASGNGRDGTITGGAWSTSLTGSQFGDTGYTFANTLTGNITWTGTIPAASTASGFTIMVTYSRSTDNIDFTSTNPNTDPWFFVAGVTEYFYVSGTATSDRLAVTAPTKVPANTYRNVIYKVVKAPDNSFLNVYMYTLGQVVASRSVTGLANNGTMFRVAKSSITGTAAWQQVAYWDRPLTDAEIDDFQNAYLIEPTPQAVAGTLDVDAGLDATLIITTIFSAAGEVDASVEAEGTLSLAYVAQGDVDVDVDLTGTQTISYALAGEIVEETDLTGAATFTVLMAGEADVDVSLEGSLSTGTPLIPLAIAGEVDTDVSLEATLFITSFVEFAGDLDAEVGLDAHLTVPPRVWVAGGLDIPVDLYGDSFEESFKAGTLDIPVDLTATATITTYPSVTNSTLLLTATTVTDPDIMLLLEPQYRLTEFFMTVGLASQAPLPVPNVPESASDTDPATATGLVLRPLGGVIVDMDTPTIQNGLPQ